MPPGCMACELSSGERYLPGGRVFGSEHWVVEHCVGPLAVGTLILKPIRHCVQVADLGPAESGELGPLMKLVCSCVRELTDADQVYVCLWSHADWQPGHIHFVIQPSWERLRDEFPGPGPAVQLAMFHTGAAPDRARVESFCERARAFFRAEASHLAAS